MYDRKTDSYWTQIEGRAIIGELSGTKRNPVSIDTVVWEDWKRAHPDSEILSRDTGFRRSYGRNPYDDYYENSSIWFPVEGTDDRAHPKTFVFGIEVNGGEPQMANIRDFKDSDERRMKEIAPRAFGVWTRLALDKTLPRKKNEEYFRTEVTWYTRRVRRKEEGFGILVAEEDEKVVGYIVLAIDRVRSDIFGFSWGHIISLAVDPDYHGIGIGSALIAAGLDWLKKKGAKYVEVLTDQNNIAAIRAYEKNNFRVIYSSIVLSQYLD